MEQAPKVEGTSSGTSALNDGLGAWLPIEPPPKDGRYLVCAETDDGPYVCEMQRLNDNWLYEGEPTYCHPFWISPTHWMPLPEAPNAKLTGAALFAKLRSTDGLCRS